MGAELVFIAFAEDAPSAAAVAAVAVLVGPVHCQRLELLLRHLLSPWGGGDGLPDGGDDQPDDGRRHQPSYPHDQAQLGLDYNHVLLEPRLAVAVQVNLMLVQVRALLPT
jgi:hypothetical protein